MSDPAVLSDRLDGPNWQPSLRVEHRRSTYSGLASGFQEFVAGPLPLLAETSGKPTAHVLFLLGLLSIRVSL
jgi:hypothetical protein